MMKEEICEAVRQILREHFGLDPVRTPPDDQSFMGSEMIDSAGVLHNV